MFHQCLFFCRFFNLLQCKAFFYRKTFHPGTDQAFHTASTSKCSTNIMTQSPYVSPLGTGNRKSHFWERNLMNFNLIKGNCPWFPFHSFSFSGQFIQFSSIHLQRRIHRRNLFSFSYKSHDARSDRIFRYLNRMLLKNFSCQILRICHNPKMQHCLIGFLFICQKLTKLCRSSKTYRKYSHRFRIQCSCMPDLFLFQDSTKPRYHIVGGIASFFIYINYSVNHCIFPLTVFLSARSDC